MSAPILPTAWRLPLATTIAALALLFAVTADTTASMVTVWQGATTYHHCFLVLPIALALIWRKRALLASLVPRQEALALLPLLLAAALWLIGRAAQVQLFEHLALVVMAIALILALLGREVARAIAFPLAFLIFLVPFGDMLVPALQQFTASFSVTLLRLAGIPVFHDGIMIETPSGLFEVAEACAGIRFLIANVMVGALFAYLAFDRLWKWAFFLPLAVALPIVANGLRAFGIILIAYLTDNEYAAGVDHLVYGWGFFAAVMLLFLMIGNMMADWPSPAPPNHEGAMPRAPSPGLAWHPAFALPVALLVLAAPLYAERVLERGSDQIAFDPKLAMDRLALDLGPACRADHENDSPWRPRFEKADLTREMTVDCGGRPVDLFLAYYARERDGAELVHHANRLADGERWTRTAASWHEAKVDGLPARLRMEAQYGREAGDRLVLAWYWMGGRLVAGDWQAKAWQLYRRLLGRDGPVAVIALSAAYEDRPEDALPDIEAILERHKGIADYLADIAPED